MRPRTLGKIVFGTLIAVCLITAFIYALASPTPDHLYKSIRGVTYSLMAITFALIYRYFED